MRWPRWCLAVLLLATAALYLWELSASGYGNTYYAAAAQAGAQSWRAWFFGALDAQGFITVDKPPAALWLTGLSVRLFGMSPWAVLAPQAVVGVAAVATLYATVRRTMDDTVRRTMNGTLGACAGLLAAAVLALTPAAALIFRYDNPDALLVFSLTAAAYATTRAVDSGSWRWLAVAGALLGGAFLTKMLQAFLVAPGIGLAYLLCAPRPWRIRVAHLGVAASTLVLSAGWWVAIVTLLPASDRPYVGGSSTDSVLDLAFGYNGLHRIVGTDRPMATVTSRGSGTGVHRLFGGEMADEISWLLPAAALALAFGVYLARRLDRTERAALLLWGGWLVVTGGVLAYMQGTEHPYYTVALAPAVAALAGLGAAWCWRARDGLDGRVGAAAMVVAAAGWSALLLRDNHFGAFSDAVFAVGAVAALALLAGGRAARPAGAVGVVAALAGSATFAMLTAATPHHGTAPVAARLWRVDGHPSPNAAAGGSWLGDEGDNAELAALLAATSTPWSAATNGAQSAAVLEIASGTSVMAVGGFSGGDPVPTLEQFVTDVHAGRIGYWVQAGGATQPTGEVVRSTTHGRTHTREIADWVAATFPSRTVGDSLVYRLT